MKEALLADFGYKNWQTDMYDRFVCPHGHLIEPDLRDGHDDCGCVSPMVQEGMI